MSRRIDEITCLEAEIYGPQLLPVEFRRYLEFLEVKSPLRLDEKLAWLRYQHLRRCPYGSEILMHLADKSADEKHKAISSYGGSVTSEQWHDTIERGRRLYAAELKMRAKDPKRPKMYADQAYDLLELEGIFTLSTFKRHLWPEIKRQ
jgi:hypothetical protein